MPSFCPSTCRQAERGERLHRRGRPRDGALSCQTVGGARLSEPHQSCKVHLKQLAHARRCAIGQAEKSEKFRPKKISQLKS
jgi:hypothetical protein